MKNEKTTSKGGEMAIVKTEPQTTPEPSQAVNQDNKVQELEAEILRLQAKLAQSPENFEERVKYYQRKQELIKRLESLQSTHSIITEQIVAISKEAAEDVFISDAYKLTVTVKNGYSSERDVLNFRNPVIIADLLSFVVGKVGEKRDQIQAEIEQ
jgi:hypothetical protein